MERIWRGYIQWKMYTVRNTWCLPVFLCMSSHRIITSSNTYYMEPCNGRRSKPQLQVNHPGWSMVKHVTPHWFHGDYCHPILASPSLIEGSHNGEACRVEAVSDGRENCVWTLVCAMKTVNPSGQSRDSIASCSSIFIFFWLPKSKWLTNSFDHWGWPAATWSDPDPVTMGIIHPKPRRNFYAKSHWNSRFQSMLVSCLMSFTERFAMSHQTASSVSWRSGRHKRGEVGTWSSSSRPNSPILTIDQSWMAFKQVIMMDLLEAIQLRISRILSSVCWSSWLLYIAFTSLLGRHFGGNRMGSGLSFEGVSAETPDPEMICHLRIQPWTSYPNKPWDDCGHTWCLKFWGVYRDRSPWVSFPSRSHEIGQDWCLRLPSRGSLRGEDLSPTLIFHSMVCLKMGMYYCNNCTCTTLFQQFP